MDSKRVPIKTSPVANQLDNERKCCLVRLCLEWVFEDSVRSRFTNNAEGPQGIRGLRCERFNAVVVVGICCVQEPSAFIVAICRRRQNPALVLALRRDVLFTPPTRTAGSRRRFSTRLKGRAPELLPRFETMDPAHPKASFREHPIPHCQRPGIMESRVSRSFHLSRVLHRNPVCRLPSYCRRRGSRRGLLVIGFFSRRALRDGDRRKGC